MLAEDQVLGFDVAMHDPLLVHVVQGFARLMRIVEHDIYRQPRITVFLQNLPKVISADELHHEKASGRILDMVDDTDDPRVR